MAFPLALLDGLSPGMIVLLGAAAVLLFGERLPEVTRTWGKKLIDLKKSFQSIQDEFRSAAYTATSSLDSVTGSISSYTSSLEGTSSYSGSANVEPDIDDRDYEEATAPKFVPPPAA